MNNIMCIMNSNLYKKMLKDKSRFEQKINENYRENKHRRV